MMPTYPKPKISVIMPSFNQGKFIRRAIQSVLSQEYPNLELIIIDGGSTDDTVQVIREYQDAICYFVSEKDTGQSDALRKGFDRANGDIWTWLNTDDQLLPGALKEVAELFKTQRNLKWVLGNVVWIDKDDIVIKCWRGENQSRFMAQIGRLTAGGPSAFFVPSLYHEVGGINVRLTYQMDTELWWKFIVHGYIPRRTKGYIWALRLHEDAKVSGAMFGDPNTEKQLRIAKAKQDESWQIREISNSFRFRLPSWIAVSVGYLRRALSTRFILGLLDTLRFKNNHIQDINL